MNNGSWHKIGLLAALVFMYVISSTALSGLPIMYMYM